MRKMGSMLGILLLSSLVFAEETVSLGIQDLEKEYHDLLQQEKNRFQEEKELSEKAEKKIVQLEQLKEEIQSRFVDVEKEREGRFFQKDFDQLIKKYEEYIKKVESEINKNQEIVHQFKTIQAIY
ncbi:hypothetical protein FUSO6_04865 [Fusobacterium necrophorum DAB]|uniref:adhesion protein FadA n=1 Tax=Fusobacterium necrophorum TaxID=859 RepID=UPI000461B0B4|nr:adhesion protein FadA [Fusobacterium necrophorum]KDE70314.1 hypothetical protein FUSO6_04865 [Fusobacterium necrophorum DAB]KDE73881.1 hypothetical protein FUSO7_05645 [Fusobacterium necrophorum BFTR-2]MCF0162243.1 hypothetical protein [Fusobacterium necrophorum]